MSYTQSFFICPLVKKTPDPKAGEKATASGLLEERGQLGGRCTEHACRCASLSHGTEQTAHIGGSVTERRVIVGELHCNQFAPDTVAMLVLLDPRLDSHVDTATTVHFSSNGLKRHRVRWVHGLAISLDHLRGTLIAGRQVHVARVAVIGLEGLLVDLLFAATEAPQLAIREDHVHDHKSVLSERLSHEVFVPPHELLKAGITLGHQEVSVVRSANRTRDLVLGALGFNKVGERQTNVG